MSRFDALVAILYRTQKNAVSLMEKDLGCGPVPVEPEIERVYQQHKAAVEQMEKRLSRSKARNA